MRFSMRSPKADVAEQETFFSKVPEAAICNLCYIEFLKGKGKGNNGVICD
jgi:hypothetical protein